MASKSSFFSEIGFSPTLLSDWETFLATTEAQVAASQTAAASSAAAAATSATNASNSAVNAAASAAAAANTVNTILAGGPTITNPHIINLTVTGTLSLPNGVVTNAMLANSSMTLAGHVVALGGTQTFAASDLTNGTTGSGSLVLATSPTISGATLSGTTTLPAGGSIGSSGALTVGTTFATGGDPNGSIELGPASAASATPYIDFHFGVGSAQDYNVRLSNDVNNTLSLVANSGAPQLRLTGTGAGKIYPDTDNVASLGDATHRWAGTYTTNLTVSGTTTLPAGGSISSAGALTLNSPISGTYTGTPTPKGQSEYNVNSITISDSAQLNGLFINGFALFNTINAGTTGGRQALASFLTFTGASDPSNTNHNYVASYAETVVNASDGGTGVTPKGAFFGFGTILTATSNATNILNINGMEINVEAAAGSSGYLKESMALVTGNLDASLWTHNIGLTFSRLSGATVGLDTLISINDFHGKPPLMASGSILAGQSDTVAARTWTFTNGIDLSFFTFTGAPFKSNGFSIDDAGTVNGTSAHFAGTVTLSDSTNGAIELGPTVSSTAQPFVDFHFGVNSSQDFNVRLQNNADGVLSISSANAAPQVRLVGTGAGKIYPNTDNVASLGDATHRWAGTYTNNLTASGTVSLPNSSLSTAVLSDYAEGTWTPADASGAGLSLTVQFAGYKRIGKLVTISFSMTYPSTTSGSSTKISGLPFTPSSTYNGWGVLFIDNAMGLVVVDHLTGDLEFYQANGTAIPNSLLSTHNIQGTVTYFM